MLNVTPAVLSARQTQDERRQKALEQASHELRNDPHLLDRVGEAMAARGYAGNVLACRNGLLHVPSGELIKPTLALYTFNQLEFDYEPTAAEPKQFLDFLHSIWDADTQSVELLQELFGYSLTPDACFQKIFMLIGPKRSGKGTIAKLLRKLNGRRNTCNPTLSSLSEPFGRQSFIGKTVAIIGDARIGAKTDVARIAEVLLSISGEDDQSVQRKFRSHRRVPATVLPQDTRCSDPTRGTVFRLAAVVPIDRPVSGRDDPNVRERPTSSVSLHH